ncbi:MAG: PEGA domain-containing protein [Acidobacteria bacterium]|nr:PEGA domain-containing protein [Acidobacteriota bacterium]
MYKKFFGLKENPFNVTPDPRFLYSTPHTEEALACLTYGVQARKGFVMLTGDVGTGKTTLLNKLLEWLRQEQIASAFVFNPRLNPFQFLDYAMSDFGINCESRLKSVILADLNNWLLARHQAGTTGVLIVDEAQDASPELLEEIRLLTNLETPSGKLLQIVLAGQQELEMKLRLPEFRQLRQRISLRAKTHPLTAAETREYIATRLRIGGSDGRLIFSQEAIESVHKYSEGIPRIINILCEDSLIGAFAEHQTVVPKQIVEGVARELELDLYPATAPPPPELTIDDMVQAGVYTDRSKPIVVSPEPPPPAERLNNEVQPGGYADLSDRGAPVSAPPRSATPPPTVRKPSAPPPAPIEPPVQVSPRTAVWTSSVETPPEDVTLQNTSRFGWAEELATREPLQPAPPAVVQPRSDKPTSDDEILQALKTKVVAVKVYPPAPAVKPPAPAPLPRQATPPPPFVAVTRTPSQSRTLWLAIAAALIAGGAGAFLIWRHTSQSIPVATVPAPAAPPVATPPSPEIAAPASSAVDNQAPAASSVASPEDAHSAPPTSEQPATKAEVHSPTPVVQPEAKVEPAPVQPPPRVRPAVPSRAGRGVSAQPPVQPSEAGPQKIGMAVVTASVEGAIITVDGKSSGDWIAPHVFPELGVGAHTVTVSKPGYEDVSTRMTIREGETSYFRATLSPSGGEITIVTEPPGLPVSFDGGPFQSSPVQITLAAGPHKYRIQLPNSRVYEGSVEMRAGSVITRRVDFTGGEWLKPAQ